MSKSVRSCCICKNKQLRSESTNLSFHRFPIGSKRLDWVKFARFFETDNVSGLHICSNHFRPEDFIIFAPKEERGVRRLKTGVVPSIYKTRSRRKSRAPFVSIPTISNEGAFLGILKQDQLEIFGDVSVPFACTVSISSSGDDVPSTEDEYLANEVDLLSNVPPMEENNYSEANDKSSWRPDANQFEQSTDATDMETVDPAFYQKAKQTLTKALNAISIKQKKIRRLCRSNTYLRRRIETLETILGHLKQMNVFSKQDDRSQTIPCLSER